jgi:enoyl-CoA hydratase/carnithine racemase
MKTLLESTKFPSIRLEVQNGVATATIDHGPMNIIDVELHRQLVQLTELLAQEKDIRVLVLQSADPDYFLAHADFNFAVHPETFVQLAGFDDPDTSVNPMERMTLAFRNLPQVTIAKINGIARGGGVELAMAMDMRFGSLEKTRLAQPETLLGVMPGGGATQYLPRLVGRARALEIILGGDLYDGHTAEQYGWINRALKEDKLDEFVDSLAKRISSLLPGIIPSVKAAVDKGLPDDLHGGLAHENAQLPNIFPSEASFDIVSEVLKRGGQTREGARDLEQLLHTISLGEKSLSE